MNYLAHAFLSFDQPQILAGNVISDFVKGKKQYDYPLQVQRGIKLHRAIDNFTDTHPAIREMKQPFRPAYRLYAGAFTDIVCDYFLANDTSVFADQPGLAAFSRRSYEQLDNQTDILPAVFKQVFVYMKQYNWLYNYQFEWSIQKSFTGMVKRATFMHEASTAFAIFENNIEKMRPLYKDFFPQLREYAAHTLKELENND